MASTAQEDGTGIPWIFIGAFLDDEQIMPDFWNAITDSFGNFIINMDSSAGLAQNPWKVEIENSSLRLIVSGWGWINLERVSD